MTIAANAAHPAVDFGSGAIISPEGLVLTARHVVDAYPLEALTVELADGRRFAVRRVPEMPIDLLGQRLAGVIGASGRRVRYWPHLGDASVDYAVLQIVQLPGARPLPFLPLATTDPKPGQLVVAFGFPARDNSGQSPHLSLIGGPVLPFAPRWDGHVADPPWTTSPFGLWFLSPVSGGFSGGPLVNAAGELVAPETNVGQQPENSATGLGLLATGSLGGPAAARIIATTAISNDHLSSDPHDPSLGPLHQQSPSTPGTPPPLPSSPTPAPRVSRPTTSRGHRRFTLVGVVRGIGRARSVRGSLRFTRVATVALLTLAMIAAPAVLGMSAAAADTGAVLVNGPGWVLLLGHGAGLVVVLGVAALALIRLRFDRTWRTRVVRAMEPLGMFRAGSAAAAGSVDAVPAFVRDSEQPLLERYEIVQVHDPTTGETWLFRPDSQKQQWAQLEHAALELAAASGLPVARSMVGTFEGRTGLFRQRLPGESTLAALRPMTDLSIEVLVMLARAHVVDYALRNSDSSAENFLQTGTPIDFGWAWADLPFDGDMTVAPWTLAPGSVYSRVFTLIAHGRYADEVDVMYRASMDQVWRTSAVPDQVWATNMRAALDTAPPSKLHNLWLLNVEQRNEIIAREVARKRDLESSFIAFWDAVYAGRSRVRPVLDRAAEGGNAKPAAENQIPEPRSASRRPRGLIAKIVKWLTGMFMRNGPPGGSARGGGKDVTGRQGVKRARWLAKQYRRSGTLVDPVSIHDADAVAQLMPRWPNRVRAAGAVGPLVSRLRVRDIDEADVADRVLSARSSIRAPTLRRLVVGAVGVAKGAAILGLLLLAGVGTARADAGSSPLIAHVAAIADRWIPEVSPFGYEMYLGSLVGSAVAVGAFAPIIGAWLVRRWIPVLARQSVVARVLRFVGEYGFPLLLGAAAGVLLFHPGEAGVAAAAAVPFGRFLRERRAGGWAAHVTVLDWAWRYRGLPGVPDAIGKALILGLAGLARRGALALGTVGWVTGIRARRMVAPVVIVAVALVVGHLWGSTLIAGYLGSLPGLAATVIPPLGEEPKEAPANADRSQIEPMGYNDKRDYRDAQVKARRLRKLEKTLPSVIRKGPLRVRVVSSSQVIRRLTSLRRSQAKAERLEARMGIHTVARWKTVRLSGGDWKYTLRLTSRWLWKVNWLIETGLLDEDWLERRLRHVFSRAPSWQSRRADNPILEELVEQLDREVRSASKAADQEEVMDAALRAVLPTTKRVRPAKIAALAAALGHRRLRVVSAEDLAARLLDAWIGEATVEDVARRMTPRAVDDVVYVTDRLVEELAAHEAGGDLRGDWLDRAIRELLDGGRLQLSEGLHAGRATARRNLTAAVVTALFRHDGDVMSIDEITEQLLIGRDIQDDAREAVTRGVRSALRDAIQDVRETSRATASGPPALMSDGRGLVTLVNLGWLVDDRVSVEFIQGRAVLLITIGDTRFGIAGESLGPNRTPLITAVELLTKNFEHWTGQPFGQAQAVRLLVDIVANAQELSDGWWTWRWRLIRGMWWEPALNISVYQSTVESEPATWELVTHAAFGAEKYPLMINVYPTGTRQVADGNAVAALPPVTDSEAVLHELELLGTVTTGLTVGEAFSLGGNRFFASIGAVPGTGKAVLQAGRHDDTEHPVLQIEWLTWPGAGGSGSEEHGIVILRAEGSWPDRQVRIAQRVDVGERVWIIGHNDGATHTRRGGFPGRVIAVGADELRVASAAGVALPSGILLNERGELIGPVVPGQARDSIEIRAMTPQILGQALRRLLPRFPLMGATLPEGRSDASALTEPYPQAVESLLQWALPLRRQMPAKGLGPLPAVASDPEGAVRTDRASGEEARAAAGCGRRWRRGPGGAPDDRVHRGRHRVPHRRSGL